MPLGYTHTHERRSAHDESGVGGATPQRSTAQARAAEAFVWGRYNGGGTPWIHAFGAVCRRQDPVGCDEGRAAVWPWVVRPVALHRYQERKAMGGRDDLATDDLGVGGGEMGLADADRSEGKSA